MKASAGQYSLRHQVVRVLDDTEERNQLHFVRRHRRNRGHLKLIIDNYFSYINSLSIEFANYEILKNNAVVCAEGAALMNG